MKPFLPQLQAAYVKLLADPTEAVRLKAAESLGIWVRLSPRTEPLINELAGGVATHADPAVRLAMATALGEVLPCHLKTLYGVYAPMHGVERTTWGVKPLGPRIDP